MRDHYHIIKEEFFAYLQDYQLSRVSIVDPSQGYLDLEHSPDIPWEVLILRVFNRDTEKIKHFPSTYSLISQLPGCTFAMFSVLHPGKVVPPHFGVYKGVWRYHLAISTPKDYLKCTLRINGLTYHWKEGEDVLFDDTYYHEVMNLSHNESRVVLLLDMKRNFKNIFLDTLNDLFLLFAKYHDRVVGVTKRQNAH